MAMTYEQVENYLESRGYELAALHTEEVEVLAGIEGFRYDDKSEKFYYNG